MIPDEQAPAELSDKVREYFNRMFRGARIEDSRSDRLVILQTIPDKPAKGKVYYFDRAIAPDILVAGSWMYINDKWSQVSNNPESAHAPTLSANWSNFGAPREVAGYYKFAERVWLQGDVVKTSGTDVIYTLPAGYRPPNELTIKAAGDSTHAEVYIKPDGTVNRLSGSAAVFFSLNGISFRV